MKDFRAPFLSNFLILACVFAAPCGAANAPRRITASYADLVDRSAMVRTGQSLGEVLPGADRSPDARGIVQPFLDCYTSLLPEMLEMSAGPSMAPYRDVADFFAPGSPQPAWVAILRGGRILLQSDGRGTARVFLPGDAPRAAYDRFYPVIRHALAGLAPPNGAPLRIVAYAYRHQYASSRLELDPHPFVASASSFPPPAGKIPLDLASLDAFFRSGAVPDGASLDRGAGLRLDAAPVAHPTLSGFPVTLADLAVAYRAVFHAGDNEAFISLDPNPDPTAATVSFGGFLENTHVGRTVLESDKRFKTITCGLDPNTFEDARPVIAARHPDFLTSAERDIAAEEASSGRWIGTRFWFYPESVEIETDPEYRTATVTNARFTADAERQRDDFANAAAFERFKRRMLSPSIRACIDDLNAHYDRYAAAFPELTDLKNVARLFGIMSWLKRGHGAEVDLDALLSVPLPAYTTPAAKPQMIVVNWVSAPENARLEPLYVSSHLQTLYLTPLLDRPIRDFFPSVDAFAAFVLSLDNRTSHDDAVQSYAARAGDPVRTLARTKEDLQVLAKALMNPAVRSRMDALQNAQSGMETAAARLRAMESELTEMKRRLDLDRAAIEAKRAEVDRLRSGSDRAAYDRAVAEFNAMAEKHNALQDDAMSRQKEYGALVDATNRSLGAFAQNAARMFSVISIGGGINLGSGQFKIRVRPSQRVPEMRTASTPSARREAHGQPAPPAVVSPSARSTPPVAQIVTPLPRAEWREENEAHGARDVRRHLAPPASAAPRATERRDENYWFRETSDGSWKDRTVPQGGTVRERSFDAAAKSLAITEAGSGRSTRIEARMDESGRIVFRRGAASAAPAATTEPAWWNGEAR